MRRIIEIEDEAVVLKDCDQRALERFQMLDQMEAEGLIHTGQRSFGFAVESAQLNAELTSATEAASQRR